ncbi:MAG: 2-oxoacid:acceptor oxidoreductase family protein [Candidatus Rokubacteria bacterium]|nr:2-oxoacid:acceptor oxidoreductase family protein [Candidatus Rokubacteria bacterium]
MKEIRFHGRGGQGAATAAEILAAALVRDGRYAAAFPMFGFERRGAPVTAFLRFDSAPIRERTQVYAPDCLIVLDPGLARGGAIFEGLRPGGTLLVNGTMLPPLPSEIEVGLAGTVRAGAIAQEELGRPAANTAMLGALARLTGWVSRESLLGVLPDYVDGEALPGNRRAVERGYAELRVAAGETTHALP